MVGLLGATFTGIVCGAIYLRCEGLKVNILDDIRSLHLFVMFDEFQVLLGHPGPHCSPVDSLAVWLVFNQ
jgi:hypothetical protein